MLKVTFSLLLEYIKSTSSVLFASFIVCYILSNVFQALASFWLREWTDLDTDNSTSPNQGNEMIIFSSLGIIQSNLFVKLNKNF